MGKYMRKAKPSCDVAVMEVSHAGVRTRAKTLALQRSTSSYLQLRSRRLEKPPILVPKRHHPKPQPSTAAVTSPPKPDKEEQEGNNNDADENGATEEASFGENVLEFEGRERGTYHWPNRLLIFQVLPDDIRRALMVVVDCCMKRDYLAAMDQYIKMAIGNAPWPIGVTMVGIHEHSAREKIYTNSVAHLMNDETTRKYLQSVIIAHI